MSEVAEGRFVVRMVRDGEPYEFLYLSKPEHWVEMPTHEQAACLADRLARENPGAVAQVEYMPTHLGPTLAALDGPWIDEYACHVEVRRIAARGRLRGGKG